MTEQKERTEVGRNSDRSHRGTPTTDLLAGICMSRRLDGVRDANRGRGSLHAIHSCRRAVCVDALVRICAGGDP